MAATEAAKEKARLEELRPSLEEHGQGHLLRFAAELTEEERGALADELEPLEFGKIAKFFKAAMAAGGGGKKDEQLQPLGESICGSTLRDPSRVAEWEGIGLEEIGRGKVGGASAAQGSIYSRSVVCCALCCCGGGAAARRAVCEVCPPLSV